MPLKDFIVGSTLMILTGCQPSLVHDSMPTITRTGEVKDVVIQDTVTPSPVMARPGDEIRWINKRQTDVQVIVTSPAWEQLTCQRNFRQTTGAGRHQYTANVERNDTAGACFREPTQLQYVVRTDSSDPRGEPSFLGTVMITTEEQLWPSMQTSQTASLTEKEPSLTP
jgi:plastocyanin